MATERQIEANRRNAARSSGPVSEPGRRAARANSLKHGLTGAGVVLPPELAERLERSERAWAGLLRPQGEAEAWHVRRIALMSVRMERCRDAEFAAVAVNRARSLLNWDEDLAIAAEERAAHLAKSPALAVPRLRSTSAGCDRLARRWARLARRLDRGEPWTEAEEADALDLLAVPPVERADGDEATAWRELAADREALRREIQAQIDALIERAAELAEDVEAHERAMIERDVHFDVSPHVRRIRSYEAACQRIFDRSLKELASRGNARAAAMAEPLDDDPLAVGPEDEEADRALAAAYRALAAAPPPLGAGVRAQGSGAGAEEMSSSPSATRPPGGGGTGWGGAPAAEGAKAVGETPAPSPSPIPSPSPSPKSAAPTSRPKVSAEGLAAILAEPRATVPDSDPFAGVVRKGKVPAGPTLPGNDLPIRILG